MKVSFDSKVSDFPGVVCTIEATTEQREWVWKILEGISKKLTPKTKSNVEVLLAYFTHHGEKQPSYLNLRLHLKVVLNIWVLGKAMKTWITAGPEDFIGYDLLAKNFDDTVIVADFIAEISKGLKEFGSEIAQTGDQLRILAEELEAENPLSS